MGAAACRLSAHDCTYFWAAIALLKFFGIDSIFLGNLICLEKKLEAASMPPSR